jgi:hypothetical protein
MFVFYVSATSAFLGLGLLFSRPPSGDAEMPRLWGRPTLRCTCHAACSGQTCGEAGDAKDWSVVVPQVTWGHVFVKRICCWYDCNPHLLLVSCVSIVFASAFFNLAFGRRAEVQASAQIRNHGTPLIPQLHPIPTKYYATLMIQLIGGSRWEWLCRVPFSLALQLVAAG